MSALEMIPFRFEQHQVRVIDIDGVPHLVGKDVADALGYADATTAIRSHCKGAQKLHPLQTSGGLQHVRILAEADVLRLIVSSTLPSAQVFERWVFEEVLPSIRKTGSYAAPQRAPTAAEMFLHNAQMMVDIERRHIVHDQRIGQVEHRIEEIADGMLMLARPAGAESIVHIRTRVNQLHGLPARIIDEVMRQSPMAPKPAGVVKHAREEAQGGSYAVYWAKDVTAVFARFVGECKRVTHTQATHPFIEGRFKLASAAGNAHG